MKIHHSLTAVLGTTMMLALIGCAPSAPSSNAFAGSWGLEEAGEPSLTISPDGSFNGTDGCNSLVGHGKISEAEFEFGDFALTRMECIGVDTWLSGAGFAKVSGDEMTVFDTDRTEIGTLRKR
ncbi:META domain-containing protein [Leucobacter tenebrionis]|uniref:META domain-containing protein n=1 Tax=Leucobacter tenebrionis TaxID=2873270 RepID=UPI001CA7577B|nr:META domain-containing protein [Leucobacter tenebrionis]QZY51345.1 META domain-containing protein [Leucobacter tenebrionis]